MILNHDSSLWCTFEPRFATINPPRSSTVSSAQAIGAEADSAASKKEAGSVNELVRNPISGMTLFW